MKSKVFFLATMFCVVIAGRYFDGEMTDDDHVYQKKRFKKVMPLIKYYNYVEECDRLLAELYKYNKAITTAIEHRYEEKLADIKETYTKTIELLIAQRKTIETADSLTASYFTNNSPSNDPAGQPCN